MLNIVVPSAGLGSRFSAHYKLPKPMIEVGPHKMMVQMVVENLNIEGHYIFIVQKEHCIKYNFDKVLSLLVPGCTIIELDGLTEGAACSILAARKYIDTSDSLLIANSDQWLDWNSLSFIREVNNSNNDGYIVTFSAISSRWSFVQSDNQGIITKVVEKMPISNRATAGVYWWARGSDFCKYTDKMIAANKKVNGEFFTSPVYQEAIDDGKIIKEYSIKQCFGTGTPEDLEMFWRAGIKI